MSVSKSAAGIPPSRQSRTTRPRIELAFLEATVVYVDGRVRVEHDERNDARGRKQMDQWCWRRNESAAVSYIAVEQTSRRAGYEGSR